MVQPLLIALYNWGRNLNYSSRLWPRPHTVTGVTIHSYELINVHERYDADRLLSRLKQDIEPGEVVYDVGANVGTYSLVLGTILKRSGGRVVGFEATPTVADWFRANVDASGLTDTVRVVAAAASDEMGTTEVYTGRAHRRNSIVREPRAHDYPSVPVEVPTCRLDGINAPPPDRIKIDTEGAELRVLQGAEGLLDAQTCILYIEPHQHGYTMSELRSYLRGFGYELVEDEFIVARPEG